MIVTPIRTIFHIKICYCEISDISILMEQNIKDILSINVAVVKKAYV